MQRKVLSGISPGFPGLSQSYRQVAHVLLTRPPLVPQASPPKRICLLPALDLHVLGTPPAFVLSQDQTLQKSLFIINTVNYDVLACSRSFLLVIFKKKQLHVFLLTYWLFCSVFKEQISLLLFATATLLLYQFDQLKSITFFT